MPYNSTGTLYDYEFATPALADAFADFWNSTAEAHEAVKLLANAVRLDIGELTEDGGARLVQSLIITARTFTAGWEASR